MKKIRHRSIYKLLPFKVRPSEEHFLMVDKIIYYKRDKKLVAEKFFSGKEWFFKGHFPGNPILPGYIISESMAQACSLFFWKYNKGKKNITLFLSSSKIRFFRAVKPKVKLIVTSYPVRIFSKGGIYKVEAHVNNKLVAKGEIVSGGAS